MTKYEAVWEVRREVVQYDGTEESWSRIRDLDWDDCWPAGWPETAIYHCGQVSPVAVGDWVTTDGGGRLFVVPADKVRPVGESA